jgi:hypothetical protein
MCVCAFFCVCFVLCLGRCLATTWSPVQGVLPSIKDQEISPMLQKVEASSQTGAMRKEKKTKINLLMFLRETCSWSSSTYSSVMIIVIENISHSTAKMRRKAIMHSFSYNSQIKCFRTHVDMDSFFFCSSFGMRDSCPKLLRTFHLYILQVNWGWALR